MKLRQKHLDMKISGKVHFSRTEPERVRLCTKQYSVSRGNVSDGILSLKKRASSKTPNLTFSSNSNAASGGHCLFHY
jgi:hypothetical protein